MSDISLYSIAELVNELHRRCSAVVVGVQYFNEDGGAESPTTYSIVEGNFVHVSGLVDLLTMRSMSLMTDVLENESYTCDDEEDERC